MSISHIREGGLRVYIARASSLSCQFASRDITSAMAGNAAEVSGDRKTSL